MVTISPPLVDSPPSDFRTFKMPSSMIQPLSGNVVDLAPRQPLVVLPSHNNFQPSFCSCDDRVLGTLFFCILCEKTGVINVVIKNNKAIFFILFEYY